MRMVSVGNLGERKNFEYLLEVLSFLVDYEIYLDIYGNGDISKYQTHIIRRDLKVRMMGRGENMPNILADYDLYISSAKCEGFGLAIFEAMATGLPVALADTASFRALFSNNAIYFDLQDPKRAASTILSIYQGEFNLKTLAQNGRTYAERIAQRDTYLERLCHIYGVVLHGKSTFTW